MPVICLSETEIASLLAFIRLEEFDYLGGGCDCAGAPRLCVGAIGGLGAFYRLGGTPPGIDKMTSTLARCG
jgi:hypothetical protein